MPKRVCISCGPIPAALDSVKVITNKFKGGLAFRTAAYLWERQYDVTVIVWRHTPLPEITDHRNFWGQARLHVVRVDDVMEYCQWFRDHAAEYDAFVMAAAVANLMPVNPWKGKFPSHQYRPGDEFDIKFTIAPRAIDIVKQVNPRACLIGYKLFDGGYEELIMAAQETQRASKANVIFANHPATAKEVKWACTPDGAVIKMDFDQHLQFIHQAIQQEYYSTTVIPLTDAERKDPAIRIAMAQAEMYDQTFPGHGTVAIPVKGHAPAFVTTSRGHRGEPVLVRQVDHAAGTVVASGKATLNAPTLAAILDRISAMPDMRDNIALVHRHWDDVWSPMADEAHAYDARFIGQFGPVGYVFPGTRQEAAAFSDPRLDECWAKRTPVCARYHGYIKAVGITDVDWNAYAQLFPDRYMKPNRDIENAVAAFAGKRTLELGSGLKTDCMFAYDKFVTPWGGTALDWDQVMSQQFDLAVARNSVNYFTLGELAAILSRTDAFIANTFLQAPEKSVRNREAAVRIPDVSGHDLVAHTLLRDNDTMLFHTFHAYTRQDWESLGLTVTPYGENSALLTKGIEPPSA